MNKQEIKKQYKDFITETVTGIKEAKDKNDFYISQYTTKFEKGRYQLSELKKRAQKKAIKKNGLKLAEELTEFEKIKNAEIPQKIEIKVEWKSSRMYGANPTATVRVFGKMTSNIATGHASGYGYDKESASIAQALNQLSEAKKLLLSKKVNGLYGHRKTDYSPGVGTDCFVQIWKTLGYKICEGHGNNFDFYSITKKIN